MEQGQQLLKGIGLCVCVGTAKLSQLVSYKHDLTSKRKPGKVLIWS